MARLNLQSITNQVREILRQDIEDGKFAPGARIYEQALAKELGISKTPIRLAIHQLERDGIVKVEPRQGIYVRLPTAKEVFELLEMREVLEGLAARRAASGADPETVRRLRACFAGIDEHDIKRDDVRFATADHCFHQTLVEASGSAELIQTMQNINIRIHMNRLRRVAVRHHDMGPIHREHIEIIDAIEAGDGDRAAMLASAHVRGVPWVSILEASNILGGEMQARTEATV